MHTYQMYLSTVTPGQFCKWLHEWIRKFNESMLDPQASTAWHFPLDFPACVDIIKGDPPYKITVQRQAQIRKASANTTSSDFTEKYPHGDVPERHSELPVYNPVALELVLSKHGNRIKLQVTCNDGHGLQLEKFTSALMEIDPPLVLQGKEPQRQDRTEKLDLLLDLSEMRTQASQLFHAIESSAGAGLSSMSKETAAKAQAFDVLPGFSAKEIVQRQIMDRRMQRAIDRFLDEEDSETSSSTLGPATIIKGGEPGKRLLNPDEVIKSLPGTRGDQVWFKHLWEWYYRYTESHRFTLEDLARLTAYSKSYLKQKKAEFSTE